MGRDLGERGRSHGLFRNGVMDFTAAEVLAMAQQGGLSVGAQLACFSEIRDGDPRSWTSIFGRVAGESALRAREATVGGRVAEAAQEWLGATVAQRARLHFTDPAGAEGLEVSRAVTDAFCQYLRAGEIPVERWEVPFGSTTLPAYASTSVIDADRVVIDIGGGDTLVEDLWFFGGKALHEAGWPVVMVDLPGQGMTPTQGLYFGADTVSALRAVFDGLRAKGFTGDVALLGWSGGGTIVTKYAEVARPEDRLRAVVASGPVHDAERMLGGMLPDVLLKDPDSPLVRVALALLRTNRTYRTVVDRWNWQFGPGGLAGVVRAQAEVGRTRLEALDVPFLALIGASETPESLCQARDVVEAVRVQHPSSRVDVFDHWTGADAHCQIGNQPLAMARAVHWLEQERRHWAPAAAGA